MKTKTIKKLLFGFIATMLFISCNKEDNEIEVRQLDPVKDKAIAEAIAAQNDKGIPFPEGSKVLKKTDNGYRIILPKNMYYLIKNDKYSRALTKVAEIDVYCTCTDGTGCSPLKSDGKYYCVMGENCSTCEKRVYSKSMSIELKGVVNLNEEVSMVGMADKKKYQCINSEVLNLKEVKDGIMKFYSKMYNGNIPSFITKNKVIPSKEYVYVKANVFGYAMVLPVLRNTVNKTTLRVVEVDAITCECLAGRGCKKEKAFGGIYCDLGNDCDSCGMHDN